MIMVPGSNKYLSAFLSLSLSSFRFPSFCIPLFSERASHWVAGGKISEGKPIWKNKKNGTQKTYILRYSGIQRYSIFLLSSYPYRHHHNKCWKDRHRYRYTAGDIVCTAGNVCCLLLTALLSSPSTLLLFFACLFSFFLCSTETESNAIFPTFVRPCVTHGILKRYLCLVATATLSMFLRKRKNISHGATARVLLWYCFLWSSHRKLIWTT